MLFNRLTIRTRLAALLIFANVLVVAAAGYAWYAIARLNSQLTQTIKIQDPIERAADLSRRAQLGFKVQVQEWKNILIRGQEQELFQRHLKSFEALGKVVDIARLMTSGELAVVERAAA